MCSSKSATISPICALTGILAHIISPVTETSALEHCSKLQVTKVLLPVGRWSLMEFFSLFLEAHDSEAEIVPYFLLGLGIMVGDPGVHSLPHCLPLGSPYMGGEQEGRTRSNWPRPSQRHLPCPCSVWWQGWESCWPLNIQKHIDLV